MEKDGAAESQNRNVAAGNEVGILSWMGGIFQGENGGAWGGRFREEEVGDLQKRVRWVILVTAVRLKTEFIQKDKMENYCEEPCKWHKSL